MNNLDKKTIIFDLDETLIHCNDDITDECDFKLQVECENDEVIDVKFNFSLFLGLHQR